MAFRTIRTGPIGMAWANIWNDAWAYALLPSPEHHASGVLPTQSMLHLFHVDLWRHPGAMYLVNTVARAGAPTYNQEPISLADAVARARQWAPMNNPPTSNDLAELASLNVRLLNAWSDGLRDFCEDPSGEMLWKRLTSHGLTIPIDNRSYMGLNDAPWDAEIPNWTPASFPPPWLAAACAHRARMLSDLQAIAPVLAENNRLPGVIRMLYSHLESLVGFRALAGIGPESYWKAAFRRTVEGLRQVRVPVLAYAPSSSDEDLAAAVDALWSELVRVQTVEDVQAAIQGFQMS